MGLTCFAVLRLGFSLPSGVDWNHGDRVISIRLQVLQHSVVGSAGNLDLESRVRKRRSLLCTVKRGSILIVSLLLILPSLLVLHLSGRS